jgi:drug/metabolite transporter (DMT)-like permease
MITTAIPASFFWQWPTFSELILLCLMGGVGIAAHSCFIRAYAIGEASALAPLDYTRIIFSTAAGFLIFATVPGWQTAVGAVIIAGSSLYITLREAQTADVEVTPSDETATPSEPMDYALRQKEERDMVDREAARRDA